MKYSLLFLVFITGCSLNDLTWNAFDKVAEYTRKHPDVSCYAENYETQRRSVIVNGKYVKSEDMYTFNCSDGVKIVEIK